MARYDKKTKMIVIDDTVNDADWPKCTNLGARRSIAGWEQTGKQSGSNPGGVFTSPDGIPYYVKGSKTPLHAQNEALAAELYAMAGVTVPEVQIVDLAGKFGDRTIGVASKMVDGEANLPQRYSDPEYADAIGKDMAVDAWLANWDTVGNSKDNIIEVGGKPHRVDVGGSLLFRAQGEPKGDDFGPKATEVDSLRDPGVNRDAADVFGMRVPDASDPVFLDGARRVAALDPAAIEQAVRRTITDPDTADLLVDRLLSRQADIAQMVEVDIFDDLVRTPADAKEYEQPSAPPFF